MTHFLPERALPFTHRFRVRNHEALKDHDIECWLVGPHPTKESMVFILTGENQPAYQVDSNYVTPVVPTQNG